MAEQRAGGFWDRVEPGHTTVLIGDGGRVPAAPRGCWLVRARADGPHRPLGPIFDARDRVGQLMGRPALDEAAGRLRRGIRRHLLGDDPPSGRDAELLADLDRLADAGGGLTALVFEAVDLADASTLAVLTRLVRQPLRPALVLGLRVEPGSGPVRELLDLVAQIEGENRIIRAPSSGAEDLARDELDPGRLSAPVRLVLRAASVIGDGFESALVARLLGLPEREVLTRLQEASDEGVAVDDLGDGRFRLSARDAEILRRSLIPSLSASWHRELAQLLSNDEQGPAAARAAPIAPVAPAVAAPAEEDDAPPPIMDTPDLPLPGAEAPAPAQRVSLGDYRPPREDEQPERDPFATLATDSPAEPAPPPKSSGLRPAPRADEDDSDPFAALGRGSEEPAAPTPVAPPAPRPVAPRAEPPPADTADPFATLAVDGAAPEGPAPEPPSWRAAEVPPAAEASHPSPEALRRRLQGPLAAHRLRRGAAVPGRAAQHLALAGEAEAAIPRFLAAAREAISDGAISTAEAYIERAMALLSVLPDIPARRALRARAHAERARVHWEGAGPEGFSLAVARDEAEAALAALDGLAEPRLTAEIQTLIAGICYDIGDGPSLERALAMLVAATKGLLAAGEAREAARLLNDQAAVWVRLGDPVRANHLLQESRRVFAGISAPTDQDRLELAETDHLLARLPLQVAARPGREDEAIAYAVAHAEQAGAVYEELGERRELARVWETLGRLERRRGALQRAWKHLALAFEVQRTIGDAMGLARTAGALAEVLVRAGRHGQALRFLADSAQMNAIKGSAVGLRSNLEGLSQLEAALNPAQRAQHGPALAELRAALLGALERLGAAPTEG